MWSRGKVSCGFLRHFSGEWEQCRQVPLPTLYSPLLFSSFRRTVDFFETVSWKTESLMYHFHGKPRTWTGRLETIDFGKATSILTSCLFPWASTESTRSMKDRFLVWDFNNHIFGLLWQNPRESFPVTPADRNTGTQTQLTPIVWSNAARGKQTLTWTRPLPPNVSERLTLSTPTNVNVYSTNSIEAECTDLYSGE